MFRALDRRSFLAAALATPYLANPLLKIAAAEEPTQPPPLDLHVHLFGIDTATTGCRMSEAITRGFAFLALSHLLKLRVPGKTLDER
jgi:hypothetical protein